jgi:hypothetical protein
MSIRREILRLAVIFGNLSYKQIVSFSCYSRINAKTSQQDIEILSRCPAWVNRQWLKRVASPAWMQLLSCTPVRYTVGLTMTTGVSCGAAIAVGYNRTSCSFRSDNTIIDPDSMRLGPVQSSCVRWFTGMTRPLRMCCWHWLRCLSLTAELVL